MTASVQRPGDLSSLLDRTTILDRQNILGLFIAEFQGGMVWPVFEREAAVIDDQRHHAVEREKDVRNRPFAS
jgi:hypothetical protein